MSDKRQVSIMFSGGLDSIIARQFATKHDLNPFCLYVDFGHPYAEAEKDSIKLLPYDVEIIDLRTLYNLIGKRMTNQIMPSRNVLLATIGSMFSDLVWINALDGEQNGKEHDKSERYFADTSRLLSYTNSFFQPQTIVESPFSHMSKAETIKWALNNGLSKDDLFQTTTCYNGNKCGECLTCYKRYTAFLLNDIVEPGYKSNPLDSQYAKEVDIGIKLARQNANYSRFTKKRVDEHFIMISGGTI